MVAYTFWEHQGKVPAPTGLSNFCFFVCGPNSLAKAGFQPALPPAEIPQCVSPADTQPSVQQSPGLKGDDGKRHDQEKQ
ncbi:MAG: hypothetical protein FRX49_04027 [Trebouxia sp. A1-2]|nr:MAG: hypothetical protein FRX49_04027 [Trebouxia sp. A1-2]